LHVAEDDDEKLPGLLCNFPSKGGGCSSSIAYYDTAMKKNPNNKVAAALSFSLPVCLCV